MWQLVINRNENYYRSSRFLIGIFLSLFSTSECLLYQYFQLKLYTPQEWRLTMEFKYSSPAKKERTLREKVKIEIIFCILWEIVNFWTVQSVVFEIQNFLLCTESPLDLSFSDLGPTSAGVDNILHKSWPNPRQHLHFLLVLNLVNHTCMLLWWKNVHCILWQSRIFSPAREFLTSFTFLRCWKLI